MWARDTEAGIQRWRRQATSTSTNSTSSEHLEHELQPKRGLLELSGEPVEPIVIKPAVPFQRRLGNWLKWFLLRENWTFPNQTQMDEGKLVVLPGLDDLRRLPLRAFLMTYEVDGFEFTSAKFTYANDPQPKELNSADFSKWLLVATFFGLPTRPRGLKKGDKVLPSLSFKELLQNFIGGWIPLFHYENKNDSKTGEHVRVWDINEKVIWQLLSLPIKFFVILPLNILRVFTKTAINIIKLFTEFLPMFVFPLVRILITVIFAIAAVIAVIIPALLAYLSWSLATIPQSKLLKIGLILLLGVPLTLPCFLFCLAVGLIGFLGVSTANYSIRLLQIVARAIFSPEKSARMAFAYGRELKGSIFGFNIGNALGVILAAISLAITAVAWALIFPIFIGAIVGYFPLLVQTITGIMQWPLVTASLNAIQSGLTIIGTALTVVFGPAITTISAFLGIYLSAAVIAFGTTLGVFAAPVIIIGSRIKDELANWWVSRHEGGPITWLLSYFPKSDANQPKEMLKKPPETVQEFRFQMQEDDVQRKIQLQNTIDENKERLAAQQKLTNDPSLSEEGRLRAQRLSAAIKGFIEANERQLAELGQTEAASDQAYRRATGSDGSDFGLTSNTDDVLLHDPNEPLYEAEL